LRDVMVIMKALSDENRARALMMLSRGELCLCQLIEMLALAPSTVSKHMSILYQAGLVNARKDGKWTFYRLPDEDAPPRVVEVIEWLKRCLKKDKRISTDIRQLKQMSRKSMKQLCKPYRR